MSGSIYPGDVRYYNRRTPYYPRPDVALPFEEAMTVNSHEHLKTVAAFEGEKPGVAWMVCDPQTHSWLEAVVEGSGVDRRALRPFIRGRARFAELVGAHNDGFDVEKFDRWRNEGDEESRRERHPEFEHLGYLRSLGRETGTPFATGGGLDDVVNWGRHEGWTVRDMIADDPGYFEWIVGSNGHFALRDEYHDALESVCPGHPFLIETRLIMKHKNEALQGGARWLGRG